MFSRHYHVAWASLIAMVAFYMSVDIYTPSMPTIARYFATSENHIQWTMTLFMLGTLLSTFYSGPLSEFQGRRRVFLMGLSLCTLASIGCYFATSADMLVVARCLQGLGGGVASVLGYSVIQDLYTEEESIKIFALMGMIFATVPAAAPLLGGFMAEAYGWRSNFFIIIALIGLSLLFVFLWFRFEDVPTPVHERLSAFQQTKSIIKNKAFCRYGLPHCAQNICEWALITLMPFYYVNVIGVSTSLFGAIMCGSVLSFGVGSWLSHRLVTTVGSDCTMTWGLRGSISTGVLFLAAFFWAPKSIVLVSAGLFLSLFFQGIVFPPSITCTLKPFSKRRASASSVRGTLNAFASLAGAYAATILPDDTLLGIGLFITMISIVGVYIFEADRFQEAV